MVWNKESPATALCPKGHIRLKERGWCILCKRESAKKYRLTHVDQYKKAAALRRNKHRDKAFLLLGNKCKDCGLSDRRVLQFDHLRDKKFNISKYLSSGWPNLEKELEKCELVCANCHAIRTDERRYRVGLE